MSNEIAVDNKGDQIKTEHTPTPWNLRYDEEMKTFVICASGKPNRDQIILRDFYGYKTSEADVAFIVRAVNAHEDLVRKLKQYHGDMHFKTNIPCTSNCETGLIIARAEGGSK